MMFIYIGYGMLGLFIIGVCVVVVIHIKEFVLPILIIGCTLRVLYLFGKIIDFLMQKIELIRKERNTLQHGR